MATATATKKPDPRSEQRSAAVLVRMSNQEREALRAEAARRNTTATDLLREQVLRVIGEA
jgi:hypothetical protein